MSRITRSARALMTKSPNDVVVLSAIRSPITRSFKGGFKDAWPEDILGPIMAEAPRRANIEAKDVQDVLIGNVLAELGFAKTGRMALLNAGFPVTTTFHTVNRQCSSSLQAATHLAHSIWAGQIDVAMAGGVESMSKNYQTRGLPADVGPSLRGTAVKSAADCLMPMGITSENVASRYKISRQMQDDFALLSHSRANHARSAGHFDSEIVPIEYTVVDGEVKSRVRVEADDTIRAGVTLEKLAKLKPAFIETGGSTAGNSSQICDGASAAILARRSWAEARDLKPLARFLGTQVAGCEPDEMGMGPLYAIPRLYKHAGIEQKDVDIFELNEAFASQTLACIHGLGLDIERVNPNGGAIAIGHPTGATGTRQLATLLAELARQDKEVGVISMCASTGLGFPIDETLKRWLRYKATEAAMCEDRTTRERTTHEKIDELYADPVQADPGAQYAKKLYLDLSSLSPYISGPNSVKVSTPLSELEPRNIKVDKAYIVSCTNSRSSDLKAAAKVFQDAAEANGGKTPKIADHVKLYIAAASINEQKIAEDEGSW
ncbi:hypothetical protein LRP88_14065 [Fusarium phalaenopsidis]